MKKTMNLVLGLVFITAGIIFLFSSVQNIGDLIWPIFILLPGLYLFHIANRKSFAYVPATILILLGIFFYFNVFTEWSFIKFLWPFFTLILGIGFINAFYMSKNKNYLIPGVIILIVTVFLFFISLKLIKFWPILLIGFGLSVIVNPEWFTKILHTAKKDDK